MSLSSTILATQSAFLRAYYLCNESSGTSLADSSGNNKPLTLMGSPILGAPGRVGTAATFDGLSQYAVRSDSVLGAAAPDEFTLFCLVKGGPQALKFPLALSDSGGSAFVGLGTGYGGNSPASVQGLVVNSDGSVPGDLGSHFYGTPFDGTWHALAFVRAGGVYKTYIDGALVGITTASQGTVTLNATALAALVRGGAGNYFCAASFQHVAIWSAGLSDAQIAAFQTALSQTPYQAIFDGDSLTFGQGSSGGQTYPAQTLALLGSDWSGQNFGVAGQTLVQMNSDAATQIDTLYSSDYQRNFLFVNGGINDVFLGADGPTVAARLRAYCYARKAVGWTLLVGTMTPAATVTGSAETARQYGNAQTRANWRAFADGIIDWERNELLLNNSNSTYYISDGVHNTNAGYQQRALMAVGAVLDFIAPEPGSELTPAALAVAVASAILADPANKIATDGSGQVTATNGGGETPQSVLDAAERINAVPGQGPVAVAPAYTPPAQGLVPVFIDIRLGGVLNKTASAAVRISYVNADRPLSVNNDWNEQVGAPFVPQFQNPNDDFPLVWLFDETTIAPTPGGAVYNASRRDAGLIGDWGKFNVPALATGETSKKLSALIDAYRAAQPGG